METFQAETVTFRTCVYTKLSDPKGLDEFLKKNAPKACYVDSVNIISLWQLQTAIYQAELARASDSMNTRSIYMEILRALSPNVRLTGVQKYLAPKESTKGVIAITLEDEFPECPYLSEPISLSGHLKEMSEEKLAYLRNVYNITDKQLKYYSLEEIIIAGMAVSVPNLVRSSNIK